MKKSAKNIMIQGTSSHVGKTVLVAALCRIFKNRGFRVAPFKAQNMALNSSVTGDGGEIGRAQALQAEAAGITPTVDLNPILLKPSGDSLSQIIIHGKVFAVMSAREYHGFKKEAMAFVLESYERLSKANDIIVIEGAGSPAEVNLRENDIANMGVAAATKSPVLLAGDIDRGGVLASIVGTMELLTEKEKDMVKGFIINKFRGDIGLLAPGLEFLAGRTGRPVLGVVPYASDIVLPDEDSVSLDNVGKGPGDKKVRIAVIRLPRVSNFTDFDALRCDPAVELRFVEDPDEVHGFDMIIIPGTKNTIEDLLWIKARGFDNALKRFHESKMGTIAGICGGFQMLGRVIKDPFGVESDKGFSVGLALLDAETTLKRSKDTFRVTAEVKKGPGNAAFYNVEGYEIHMGETLGEAAPFSKITGRNGRPAGIMEGGVSEDGRVWGTYIHGIFDNDPFREALVNDLLERKGMKDSSFKKPYKELKEESIARISKLVEESLRMDDILGIMGVC
jgi:adenosylcobyric acid synthase